MTNKSEQLKEAPAQVAGELLDAFDTVKAYRDVIPANYYDAINDAIVDWTYELEQEGRLPQARTHADEAPDVVNDEAVRDLVDRILPRDDDEAAKAFITLIHALAYNDDRGSRDSIAMYACDAAYQRTHAYSGVAGKFFDEATAEFRLRAA